MIDREKVIKGLEWVIVLFNNYERHAMGDEEMQSLNDAIVLLKAQESLQDNDLISRAAAIDAIVSLTAFINEDDIKKFVEEKACDDYFLGGICDAIDEIKNIPTVDAVPVIHGRWIEPVPGDGFPYCSNCKKIALDRGLFLNRTLMDWHLTPYCPHCGAKMDGGVQDDD